MPCNTFPASMNTSKIGLQKLLITTGVIFVVLFSWIMPVVASAAEMSANATAQTVQLLPPNVGNTCPQLQTPIFKAYVYDNAVNSFDVTIADPSYVAIAGSVGETQIPFNLMTRFVDASGVLHMHVDTPAVSVRGTLPVTLTLLSVRSDKTVCAATVSAVLVGSAPESTVSAPTGGSSDQGTYTPPTKGQKPTTGKPDVVGGIIDKKSPDGEVVKNFGIQNALAKVCATASGATRLWTVLLAVYLLIVAATILAQPTGKPSDQSTVLLGAAIVIPLIVLLGVWGSAASCRVGMWVPIAALAIAAVGFALGFRNRNQFSKTFTPPQAPKSPSVPSIKPLITPPPKTPPPPPPAPKNDKDK